MMVDSHPDNWEPEIDGRRYPAVRAAPSGRREIVEFWGVIGDGCSTYAGCLSRIGKKVGEARFHGLFLVMEKSRMSNVERRASRLY